MIYVIVQFKFYYILPDVKLTNYNQNSIVILILVQLFFNWSFSQTKNEPFPDSKEVLQQRLEMYKLPKLFNEENCIKINGDDAIVFNAAIIKKKIFPILKANNAS